MLESRVNRLEQQVDVLFRDVNRNAQDVSQKPDLSYMQSGFTEVMEWIAQYETRFSRVEADITGLKNSVAGIDQRIDRLEGNVQQILDILRQQ